ncbi:FAD-binding oxidoreductase [Inquilinus limosus]|uniref:FAD-linked oxidase n=1 Tax=Inquilinus limosus TaxID=171674 RepID=A0A211Z6R8_9PROT|nr:FAD-binding oxidoreductase [Inquilinus limosus]OWJ60807.1 FAD-linked oxidase [Inquilinus limosus]
MQTHQLKRRDGAPVDAAAVEAFRQGFAGRAILPQDEGYDSARQIWNAHVDKHPGLIARCAGTADVVHAVRFARANDLLVAVRGGGHNVAGRALCDDGIVIDLSAMTGVFVDPQARTVRVRGGTTLGELDRETQLHGLAVPVGVVSPTGIGGLALGGGVGWLVRKHGLTCDNLLSAEVVTAEGEVVTADAGSHPDLFWGLRGGGGNFGIVTSFLFRAHPVATVLGGLVVYPREVAAEFLRHYREVMATAPDELTAYAGLISTPDGAPATAVVLCYSGDDLAAGERAVRPLRSFGTPLLDAVQPMPFLAMQSILDGAFPDRAHNYWKSTFLTALTDAAIDTIVEHGNRAGSPLSGVVVECYGGAYSRVGATDTAYGQRQSVFNLGITAQWLDPADGDRHIAWARAAWEAMQPYSSGGGFLNFIDNEPAEVIRAAFGPNYDRLAAVKAKYDPDNFFSLNQNVPPAR